MQGAARGAAAWLQRGALTGERGGVRRPVAAAVIDHAWSGLGLGLGLAFAAAVETTPAVR